MKKKKSGKQLRDLFSDKGTIDFTLLIVILALVCIGVVMIFSASSYITLHNKDFGNNPYYYLIRQGLYAVVGVITMLFITKINFKKYNNSNFLSIALILTVIFLVIARLSPAVNGAHRWVDLGPISFQPSEMAKYLSVFMVSAILVKKGDKIKKFWGGIMQPLIIAGALALLVLAGKSLSVSVIIGLTTLILIMVAGAQMKHLAVLFSGAVGLGLAFIIYEPYRLERLMFFIDPFKDAKGKGYQLIQSWYALSSGGLFGQGLGLSRQKAGFLPEPQNDFIFAVIGEELGFLGCLLVIILMLILVTRGINIATCCEDAFGRYLAVGITSVMAFQAIINIAVVAGAMPVTGIPFPFISAGGTALMINLAASGVLLNISMHSKMKKK